MGLKLEVGKYYKTRDGRKAELLAIDDSDWNGLPLKVKYPTENLWLNKDGIMQMPRYPDDDLISEWPADDAPICPVRTVTRKEIQTGVYLDGSLIVSDAGFGRLQFAICTTDPESFDRAMDVLGDIRDALEEQ